MLARRTENPGVRGSILPLATIQRRLLLGELSEVGGPSLRGSNGTASP
jgi:hypothetical protein